MSISSEPTTLSVALIGNPNTGKSTLFSALVGVHQHVANYPGATVEKRTGRMQYGRRHYELIDLPGLYSLAPRSRDEMVAVDVLLGRQESNRPVDAIVCIVDAGNLERNLYLVSQVLELGVPTVLAVNMLDVAESHGIALDLDRLTRQFPVSVVGIQANRRKGIDRLKRALADAVKHGSQPSETPFPEAFESEVARFQAMLLQSAGDGDAALPPCLVRRLLLDVDGYLESALLPSSSNGVRRELAAARCRLAEEGCAVPAIETMARFGWAREVLAGVVTEPSEYQTTASDRIDRVLTHRVWGTLLFAAVMLVVFQAVFAWGKPLMGLIDVAADWLGGLLQAHMAEGALRSLLVDGVITGVGGVLAFLPQILILFLFIGVLEDCGYMARAAYLMDKTMARIGLNGKSVIPMLSSFACAIPGIMAARVIENERDRLTTILVAPLMTCSARLPVYALLIAAFIPGTTFFGGILNLQGLTLAALYVLGIVAAIVVVLLLKRTLLRGQTVPFVLELPSYKWPSPRVVLYRVFQRGWLFLRCAGTLILAVSIIVWAGLYFPHNAPVEETQLRPRQRQLQTQLAELSATSPHRESIERQLAGLDHTITAAYHRQSVLGHVGRAIEPAVRPLGWDWRIGCAVVASFPARELVVATMGVVFNEGDELPVDSHEDATHLQKRLHSATWEGTNRPLFNVPVALSILVFFALCAQCAATLVVIRRETNSWRWPAFTFAYMTTLAYLGALVTYQIGTWISG